MKLTRRKLRKMIMESMLGRGRMSGEDSVMLDRRIDTAMETIKNELADFYMSVGIMAGSDQRLGVYYGGMSTRHSVVIDVASYEGTADDQYQIENFLQYLVSMGYDVSSRVVQTAVTGDPDDAYTPPEEYFTFTVSV